MNVILLKVSSCKFGLTKVAYMQNISDLSDLVSSGRDRKAEEIAFEEECALKSLAFRAERFVKFSHLTYILKFISIHQTLFLLIRVAKPYD